MSHRVREALAAIVDGRTLTIDEARLAMGEVMDGEATASHLAALLMGLRMRGETVDELAGFASAMRERVTKVEAPEGAITRSIPMPRKPSASNMRAAPAIISSRLSMPEV